MPTSPATKPDRDSIAAALRESGYRVTAQRLVIAEALSGAGRHLSAEEVLAEAGERLPNVSLPTVYSALDVLEDAGVVRRVAAGRGPALYDAGTVPPHHHLVCRRCGAVVDLKADVRLDPALEGATLAGFAPEGAEVVVRGVCAACRDAPTA
jgi:Fur family ferric uptake transcriptional regulator